jgi:ligand-binding sensor domain-containing protein/serine phosphatase RsbU (regulator of sigma subunit)
VNKYFFFGILLFWHFVTIGQLYNFKSFSVDEGLPQGAVLSIHSDFEGYLHIGTQAGYSFFDGITFKTLNQKNGLNSNHVTVINRTGKNEIWLGHRYDAPTILMGDSVLRLKGGFSDSIKSATKAIVKIKNKVYIGTEGNGLFVYEDGVVLPLQIVKNNTPVQSINQLRETKEGKLLIATNKGLFIQEVGGFRPVRVNTSGTEDEIFRDILIQEDGSILALNPSKIVEYFLLKDEVIMSKVLHKKDNNNQQLWSGFIKTKNKEFWIRSDEGATFITNGRQSKLTTKNGLLQNHVSALSEDSEGNVWLGLFGQGLLQFKGDHFRTIDTSVGLIDNTVQAIAVFKNDVWVGTASGLTKYSFETAALQTIQHIESFTNNNGLIDNEVFGLHSDGQGNIWISSMNGVVRYSYNLGKFEKFPSKEYDLPNFVLSVTTDNNGDLWMCSLSDGCAKVKFDERGRFEQKALFNVSNGFFSNRVWMVFKDSKGILWFGSDDNGLLRIKDGQQKLFSHKDGLTNLRSGSISEDIYGNIWVGSIGGGVYKYDGNQFINYNSEDGISTDNPYFVAADEYGAVWIGSNRGVDRFDVKDESIFFYGVNEGFKGIETNQNAFCRSINGNLWFGTVKGVIQCIPENMKEVSITPKISINGIRIFLKEQKVSENQLFNYDQNYLTFDFLGVFYSDPASIKYSFILEGFDNDWSPITIENAATYSNLPPGDFVFKVKAMGKNGLWSEPASFRVHITPPFWYTWWFNVLAISGMILFIYLIFRLRTNQLRRQRVVLKQEVEIRTKELYEEKFKVEISNQRLEEQNVVLESKNKDITDSIRYAERIQNGMLPGNTAIKSILPNYFIYFKPRDIVSGDFYWFREINGIKYFAAIDCTGHGVPGAFMSLIRNDLLNQVTSEEFNMKSGELLSTMHEKLRHYFLKEDDIGINDGMDMSLCVLHPDGRFEYSGARRPLFLIRNGELNIVKGDSFSIGEAIPEKIAFQTHTIDLHTGDMIYVFSDGYPDQFGGPSGKKFMIKRFRELLISVADMPLAKQQAEIDREFMNWKGEHEQVDDVCIIGVRI